MCPSAVGLSTFLMSSRVSIGCISFAVKGTNLNSLRQLVETDISGLHGILGELTVCRSDLEAHVESLKTSPCLKKSHEEVRKMAKSLKDPQSDKVKLGELMLSIFIELE